MEITEEYIDLSLTVKTQVPRVDGEHGSMAGCTVLYCFIVVCCFLGTKFYWFSKSEMSVISVHFMNANLQVKL